MLDFVIDPEATEEEATSIEAFFDAINDNLDNGNIRMEIDEDGEYRIYSS
jgi:hypothetical protein